MRACLFSFGAGTMYDVGRVLGGDVGRGRWGGEQGRKELVLWSYHAVFRGRHPTAKNEGVRERGRWYIGSRRAALVAAGLVEAWFKDDPVGLLTQYLLYGHNSLSRLGRDRQQSLSL